MIDRTISHYKITGKLGEGGMGVVYKAEDTQLERTVALKFLAAHLLQDEEARKRFHREAKAAASLHHPNVCPVYEIAEAEGRTFISMAFIEGESLDKRIEQGPLKIPEALDIAQQIAKGLEAAHEKKVVHRDIKPGNVIVDGKSHVTVMDFGLALLTEGSKLTQLDTTVGTVAYMSPEQAQGVEVDHRADIWALGCVLYEMVCGQRPCKGLYDKALLYEIVHEDYEPLTGVRAGVPMELEFTVTKCLAKDREERYKDAGDLIVDLKSLHKRLESGRSTVLRTAVAGRGGKPPQTASQPPADAPERRNRLYLYQGLLAVSVVVAAILAFVRFGEQPVLPRTIRFSIAPPHGWTLPNMRGLGGRPEISPGGTSIAFGAVGQDGTQHIWIRDLDSSEARILPNTEGGGLPFWSPEGNFLAFFADGKLRKISINGGAAIALADAPSPRGGTWGKDSATGEEQIVFAPENFDVLSVISATGGEPAPVTVLDEERAHTSHRAPHFLPDGRRFLYMARTRNEETFGVYGGSVTPAVEGSGPVPDPMLLRANAGVWYAPPTSYHEHGYLLFELQQILMAQPFDPVRLELTGEAVPAAEGIESAGGYSIGGFSVSGNGVVTYRAAERPRSELVWYTRNGKRLGEIGKPGFYGGIDLSPDDRTLALSNWTSAGATDVMLFDLEKGIGPTPFTFNPSGDSSPVWSPDGSRIAFRSYRDGRKWFLYMKAASGAGDAERLAEGFGYLSGWSGDFLVHGRTASGRGSDIWVVDVKKRQEFPYLQTDDDERSGVLSPDGRWMAYVAPALGQPQVWVRPFPDAEAGRWQISTEGGSQPRWRSDGRELFYVSPGPANQIMAVEVSTGPLFEYGRSTPLFTVELGGGSRVGSSSHRYDLTADGKRFVVSTRTADAEPQSIEVVVNWQGGLASRNQ